MSEYACLSSYGGSLHLVGHLPEFNVKCIRVVCMHYAPLYVDVVYYVLCAAARCTVCKSMHFSALGILLTGK